MRRIGVPRDAPQVSVSLENAHNFGLRRLKERNHTRTGKKKTRKASPICATTSGQAAHHNSGACQSLEGAADTQRPPTWEGRLCTKRLPSL